MMDILNTNENEEKITISNVDRTPEERKVIDTALSLHPSEGDRVSDFQKTYLMEEITELPPIKEGDLNISGVYIYETGDQYEVKFYIRNGINKKVNFESVPLNLLNSKKEVLAHQIFDLKELGDIEPLAARPWKVYFDKANLRVDKIDPQDWKIAFDTSVSITGNIRVAFEGIPEGLDENSKNELEAYLKGLPLLKEREYDFSTFHVAQTEKGGILVVYVIRNGYNQEITINEMPITVKDDKDKLVAGAVFTVDIAIGAHKAKVCTVEFSEKHVSKGQVNLENLHVDFKFRPNATLERQVEEEVVAETVVQETAENKE